MAGRIKGITIEIGGDTTKLDKSLKDVDSTIRQTQSSLKDVNKLLKLDPKNTELLTQKQRLLGDSIQETKVRLGRLREAAANVTPEDIGQDKYDALQREIAETEQKLKDLEKQAKETASVLGSQMQVAGEKMKDVGKKVTDIGTDLTTKVTLPLAAVGAAGVKSFAEVDKTMQLTNKTMGNTEDEAQMLSKAMKDAAMNSTFGMNDAATATLNFARAGLDAEQAAAALAPSMNLAAGEGGNLDTVSAGLVATINGFHGSFDEAGHYADVFAAACNNSALDVDSLSGAMSVAAPVFSAAGYSIDDAALYMGVMANNGIEANKAANSLKTGLARLVDPPKAAAEELDKLNWSITDGNGQMKDATTIQRELHDAFAGLSESEQIAAASAIFGKDQFAPWLALINTAPGDVSELDSALANCAGTTDEMSSAMMDGFGGSLEKLKSSVDVAVTSLGEALAPTIEKVSDKIQELVDAFNSLSPEQQEMIVQIGLVVAAIGPVLVIIGTLITTIGTIVGAIGSVITVAAPIIGMIGGIIGSIHSLSGLMVVLGAIITGPVGIVVAIAAAVAAGIALWKNWDTVKEKAGELKDAVVEKWNAFKENTAQAWENMKESVSTAISDAKEKAVAKAGELKENVSEKWNQFKENTSQAWNNAKETIGNAISDAKEKAVAKATELKEGAVKKWEEFKSSTSEKFASIQSDIQTKLADAKANATSKAEELKASVAEKWDSLKQSASEKWASIKESITSNMAGAQGSASGSAGTLQSDLASKFASAQADASAKFASIKQSISEKMATAKSDVNSKIESIKGYFTGINAGTLAQKFSDIKDKIKEKMDSAKKTVSDAIENIKSKFNFSWSLPKLKLPHVSISGSFSLVPPKAPSFSVSWYKTAMENGQILTNPTIFGMSGGKFLGGGDAGPEAVVGVTSLKNMIRDAVKEAGGNDPDVMYEAVKAGMQDANIGIYVGERQLGRTLREQGVVMV